MPQEKNENRPATTEELKKKLIAPPDAFNIDDHDRLTVNFSVHFEQSDSQPVSTQSVYSNVTSAADEEAYRRRMKVDNHPKQLDLGWLSEHSIMAIYLQNFVPMTKTKPTKEEKEQQEKNILCVSFEGDNSNQLLVLPDSFLFFRPLRPDGIWLHSLGDSLTIQTIIIPG